MDQAPIKKKRKAWKIVLIVIASLVGAGIILLGVLMAISYFSTSWSGSSYDDDYYQSESKSLTKTASRSIDLAEAPSSAADYALMEVSEEGGSSGGSETSTTNGALTEQKIIKTAYLSMTVEAVADSVSDLTTLTETKGGFVKTSEIETASDNTQSATVVLRVPVKEFNSVVEATKDLATQVNSEEISGQDVTEEYMDLQARLKNYQAEEAQYQEILKQATTIEDILLVTDELSDVREDIEIVQGRIKYLENYTDLSTITVYLYEEASISLPTTEWKPLRSLKTAFQTLIRFGQGTITTLIWALMFGLPIGLVALIVYLVVRAIRKRKKYQE